MALMRESCQQYIDRRLSEGWKIAGRYRHLIFLSPPDGAFIRPVDLRNDIETLRPNAAGDETSIASQYPSSGEHWDKVDEETPDDNSTYVYTASGSYQRDLYNLPAHSLGSGTINSITIYFRCRGQIVAGNSKCSQKSGTTVTDGGDFSESSSWVTHSQTYTTNPATNNPYTWPEIDDLQIGLCLKGISYPYPYNAYCTQVYVEIDYTPAAAVSDPAAWISVHRMRSRNSLLRR